MQESPLISVIVPVYKVEQYLARCLESICGQTYRNLEIICVDDGSPDKSIDILNEFASRDLRIRILRQENQGVSAARNMGIQEARGEWITFVDSDDWIEAEAYASCVPHLSNEVDVVIFGVKVDNELPPDDPQYAAMEEECKKISQSCLVKYDGITPLSDEVILTTNISIWNKLFRKSILVKYNILFPIGRWYEDCSFNYKFLLLSRCGYFLKRQKFYHYIQREFSITYMTRAQSPRAIQHLDVISDVYDVIREHQMTNRSNLLAIIANMFIGLAFHYVPKRNHGEVQRKAGSLIEEIGIANRTEFSYISLVRGGFFCKLSRLFYRRRLTKREWGLFGLMIFAIQNKNGMNVGRLFGIRLWTKPEKEQN